MGEESDKNQDDSVSRLSEIYSSIINGEVTANNTKFMRLHGMTESEVRCVKSVAAESKTSIWKSFSKASVLGAGELYASVVDLDIDKLARLTYSIYSLSSREFKINMDSSLRFGTETINVRIPYEFYDWVTGNMYKSVDFSYGKCLKWCFMAGLDRYSRKEKVNLPKSIKRFGHGIQDIFSSHLIELRKHYEGVIYACYIMDKEMIDSLTSSELDDELGSENVKTLKSLLEKHGISI